MKKLTKHSEARLQLALSCDDLLYRKYLQLMDQVHRESRRLIHDPARIRSVIGLRGEGHIRLQVMDITTTPEGTQITVRL